MLPLLVPSGTHCTAHLRATVKPHPALSLSHVTGTLLVGGTGNGTHHYPLHYSAACYACTVQCPPVSARECLVPNVSTVWWRLVPGTVPTGTCWYIPTPSSRPAPLSPSCHG